MKRPGADDLKALARGERDALSRLFDEYFDRIYALVHRMLGNRADAEDLSQEVFLKACNAAHALDAKADLWAWLMTIACNTCRDHWRSRRSKINARTGPTVEADEAPAAPDADPAEMSVSQERSLRVRRALLSLERKQRMVLVLREFERLSHDDIAAILGISSAASRKQYSRGLRELARMMEPV